MFIAVRLVQTDRFDAGKRVACLRATSIYFTESRFLFLNRFAGIHAELHRKHRRIIVRPEGKRRGARAALRKTGHLVDTHGTVRRLARS